jgi:hypothetical protein
MAQPTTIRGSGLSGGRSRQPTLLSDTHGRGHRDSPGRPGRRGHHVPRFAGTSGVLTSLTPQKRYYFRVSVLDATGTRVSGYASKAYPTAVTAAMDAVGERVVVPRVRSAVA